MRTLLVGAQAALLRAIHREIAADQEFCRLAGVDDRGLPPMIVESAESRDWTSATFLGHEHRIDARLITAAALSPAALDRLGCLVDVAAIELHRHIVVELTIAATPDGDRAASGTALTITAITVDD